MPRTLWLGILGWRKFPISGKIHNLPSEEFRKNYYIPPSINEVISDLEVSLLQGDLNTDKLIVGKPGCGKTTFIYYLINIFCAERPELENKYYFVLVHFNRFISASLQQSYRFIEKWILDVYSKFLCACGYEEEANGILRNEELPEKISKINALIDLIKENKHHCPKKLILFIDDIDESPSKKVEPVLRHLFSFIETSVIEKWLTVRGTTLDQYPKKLLKFIRSKFPETIDFPRVDLFGILSQRINAIQEEAQNPFGMRFCSQLIKAFNEDLREALASISNFLSLKPPSTVRAESSLIMKEKYFMQNFLKLLVKRRIFPNIFLASRSSRLPIERDILLLLDVKHTIDEEFKLILNESFVTVIKALTRSNEIYRQQWLKVSTKEINASLEFLYNNQLIEIQSKDCFTLTSRGRIFTRVLFDPFYIQSCKEEVELIGEQKFDPFWRLVKIDPNYGGEIF